MATIIVSENIQYSITPTLHFSDSSLPAEPIISDPRRRVFILTPKTWSSESGQSACGLPKSKAMGQWNNGKLECCVWRKKIDFYMDNADQKLIRLRRTAFHTQYSIIPPFHYSIGYRTLSNTHLGVISKLGP
jgi:hypothetical protein